MLSRLFCFISAFMFLNSFVYAEEVANVASPAPTAQAQTNTVNKLNLNAASLKELLTVKGMTTSKAKAIISYRKQNGEFKSVTELSKVKGFKRIREEKLKEIVEQLKIA